MTPDEPLPLAGLTVLDISSFIAAPAAAAALGDFGADVIKIEPPGDGDPHRNNFRNASYPQSDRNFPWQLDGRHKRSLALDLKHPEGLAALRKLIARADVFVSNVRPEALAPREGKGPAPEVSRLGFLRMGGLPGASLPAALEDVPPPASSRW
jgi:formyl-CoA transferase